MKKTVGYVSVVLMFFSVAMSVVLFTSCVSAEQVIQKSWDDKYRAISESDVDTYMNTISLKDPYYRNESYAWFWYMANNDFQDLSFTITGTEKLNPSTMLVHINQKHRYAGEDFDFNYTIVYRRENGDWRDCDLNFLLKEADGFRICYMDDEKNLYTFERFILGSNRDLMKVFGLGADENFPVKLYTDRELLRQRTFPIIERQFTAWGESNEALKIYTGFPNLKPYEGTIRHELVHHITLKMSSNRLPSWYAEGLAVHYGNCALYSGNFVDLGRITLNAARRTITSLEEVDVESMVEKEEIDSYYGTSGMIVQYISETWGDKAHTDILNYLGKDSYFDRAKEKDPDAILLPILHETFEAVLGVTADQLSEGYVVWLDEKY